VGSFCQHFVPGFSLCEILSSLKKP
jgi:hypothetical protein